MPATAGAEFDYQALAKLFMTPMADTPHELSEALYFISELATDEGMAALRAEAEKNGLQITNLGDCSPADMAIQVWLKDRHIVERKHAERYILRPKSFVSFQTPSTSTSTGTINRQTLKAIEQALDNWFEQNGKGRTSQIFHYPKGAETWFMIRHGHHYKREGGIKDGGESTSIFYRPEVFDVLIYNDTIGELSINADSSNITDLYREQFGLHLFGDSGFFPKQGSNKYTLEPLRQDAQAALVCSDIAGIQWIQLRELHLAWDNTFGAVEIRRASDLLASCEQGKLSISPKARLVKAKFRIKFTNAKNPRMVAIRPSNIASYIRTGDSGICARWLTRRGFMLNQPE